MISDLVCVAIAFVLTAVTILPKMGDGRATWHAYAQDLSHFPGAAEMARYPTMSSSFARHPPAAGTRTQ